MSSLIGGGPPVKSSEVLQTPRAEDGAGVITAGNVRGRLREDVPDSRSVAETGPFKYSSVIIQASTLHSG